MVFVRAATTHIIKLVHVIGLHTILQRKRKHHTPKVMFFVSAFEPALKIVRHAAVYKRLECRYTLPVQEEHPKPGSVTAEGVTHSLLHEFFEVGVRK
jgi:hypothetical protein